MHTASSTTVGRGQRAAFHLVTELELAAPFWQYRRLYEFEPFSFLLDSAKDPEKLGRFSFVGGDPFLVFKAKRTLAPGMPATGADRNHAPP